MLIQPPPGRRRSSPSPPAQEERVGERRPVLLNAPLPAPSAVELRSADFSPPRAGSPKSAESGLKSALQVPCDSVNSRAVQPCPLSPGERVNRPPSLRKFQRRVCCADSNITNLGKLFSFPEGEGKAEAKVSSDCHAIE